jgi:hypothetical protein
VKRKRRKGPKVLVAQLLVDCLADWMNPGGLAVLSAGLAALKSGRLQDARRRLAEAAQAVPGDAPVELRFSAVSAGVLHRSLEPCRPLLVARR